MMMAAFVALVEVRLYPSCFSAFSRFIVLGLSDLFSCFHFLIQSTGGFIAVARYASATPLPPSILSRGVGWQVKYLGYYNPISPSATTKIEVK